MWTPATRKNYSRNGLRYQSDVTDEEWRVFEPYLPPAKGIGRPRGWPLREIVNGIFYVMRSGCPWRKGAAEDESEEERFEEAVSTASVKPSTVTEIEAINIKATSLGIAPSRSIRHFPKVMGMLKKDGPRKLRTPTATSRAIFSPACSALRPPRRFGFRR